MRNHSQGKSTGAFGGGHGHGGHGIVCGQLISVWWMSVWAVERLCFIGRTGAYGGKDMAKTVVLSQRVQRVMWTMLEDCCMGGPKGRIAHGRV